MDMRQTFAKAFGITYDNGQPNVQTITSRRIQGGPAVFNNSGGIGTLGVVYSPGTVSIGSSSHTFGQHSFGLPTHQGSYTNKPMLPFEFLEPLDQAKLIKEFLIKRGVNIINKETANALFLVSCDLNNNEIQKLKYKKKKIII
jgi:hypothetical protein